MPSQALLSFEKYIRRDVNKLIAAHGQLKSPGMGKQGLGYITRSGVVALCAAWETYIEDVLCETVDWMTHYTSKPQDLPRPTKTFLAKYTREAKNELTPLQLAGNGWKALLNERVNLETDGLNTPKPGKIDELFRKYTGIDNLSQHWSCGPDAIREFVEERGDIAHKGAKAAYTKISHLEYLRDMITLTIIETDNFITNDAKSKYGYQIWRRRAI